MDFLIGFLAGFAGGLGVGGGGILLLCLTVFGKTDQLSAQGINLVFFLPVAAVSLFIHIKKGFVNWKTALFAAFCGIPGVLFGLYIAGCIEKDLLRALFAVFLLVIGIRELLRKEKQSS